MKVVIHVGNVPQWEVAVKNSKNLKAVESNSIIEIVVNSHGITVFDNPADFVLDQLALLFDLNTSVKLCRKALAANSIKETALPEGVEVVPAGIVELIKKQEEGYAYISP